jgi:hypothetical protein
VNEVLRLLAEARCAADSASSGLERKIVRVHAAVVGALAVANTLFDDNYREFETLVLTLKKILDAITPENVTLDGQTLLLVDITVRPENSDRVFRAVHEVLLNLPNHPSMEGISVVLSNSRLL